MKALVGATLIDGTGGPVLPDAPVLIDRERIEAVGSRAPVTVRRVAGGLAVHDRVGFEGESTFEEHPEFVIRRRGSDAAVDHAGRDAFELLGEETFENTGNGVGLFDFCGEGKGVADHENPKFLVSLRGNDGAPQAPLGIAPPA